MATPGYDMYYLNVMAGPSADRAWLIADDPDHGWIRHTWETQATDPRLPIDGSRRRRSGERSTVRCPGAGAVPRRPVLRARWRGAALFRRLLRHLRPRQHRRHGPGAPAEPRLRYYQAATSRLWCIPPSPTPKKNRLQTLACTSSIGPGATNMVTGAALATINRLPVLLLPGDIFARRNVAPVLQQLESLDSQDISVNDCFKPVSPLLGSHQPTRSVADGAARGDACADQPSRDRRGHAGAAAGCADRGVRLPGRALPRACLACAAQPARPRCAGSRPRRGFAPAERPLIVAGGGVIYAEATEALRRLAEQTGIPVGETRPARAPSPYDHPVNLGAIGATGTWPPTPGARCRPGDRHRHTLQRLHHRLQDRLPAPRTYASLT